jgi:hypothetical protein
MGVKKFIDRLLNNHFEIIKNEVEEYDYPIDYYYFADKYGHFGNPGKNVNYEDLKEQVAQLRRKLEDAGYKVTLDMQYGLKLTVSKIETEDYNDKEIIGKNIEVSENLKSFKYLKRFK